MAILVYVVKEFRHLTTDVHEIKEAPNRTVFGVTDDLNVGDKVHVVEPRPGVAREDWRYKPELYVIRAVDKVGNKAMATRVSPSVQGPTPTVVGPARESIPHLKRLQFRDNSGAVATGHSPLRRLFYEPHIRTVHRHRLFGRSDAQVEPQGSARLRSRPSDRSTGSLAATQSS